MINLRIRKPISSTVYWHFQYLCHSSTFRGVGRRTVATFPLLFLLGRVTYPDMCREGQCCSFVPWMTSKHRQERGEMGERSIVLVSSGNVIQKVQCAPREEGAAFGTRGRAGARDTLYCPWSTNVSEKMRAAPVTVMLMDISGFGEIKSRVSAQLTPSDNILVVFGGADGI